MKAATCPDPPTSAPDVIGDYIPWVPVFLYLEAMIAITPPPADWIVP